MNRTKELEHKMAELATKAEAVIEDDRAWSEKAVEVDGMTKDIKSLAAERSALLAVYGSKGDLKSLAEAGNINPEELPDGNADGSRNTKSIGHQFVEADAYQTAMSSKATRFSTGGVDVKATFVESAGAAGGLIPQYMTSVTEILFRRLVVSDLLPAGAITGSALIYPKESTVINAAAAVAEGAAKPASDLNLVQVTENLKKIATTLKVSDETLQDIPFIQSYVDARLSLFVRLTEEDQILNGSGVGANMTGILNRAGLQAAIASDAATGVPSQDAIYKQITAIRSIAFVEPDGIVIHPTDWQTLRLRKDLNGQYYSGGPFTGAYGQGASGVATDSLWGLRVVITPAIAQGTALVGSFMMCSQLFRKGGLRVEATNSNEDDFLKNLVAIRAEERLALAVYRPGGFGKVTGIGS